MHLRRIALLLAFAFAFGAGVVRAEPADMRTAMRAKNDAWVREAYNLTQGMNVAAGTP